MESKTYLSFAISYNSIFVIYCCGPMAFVAGYGMNNLISEQEILLRSSCCVNGV